MKNNKQKKVRYPSKREMNLYMPVRDGNSLIIVIPAAIIMALLIGVFTKFCVLDKLNELNDARGELATVEETLHQTEWQLANYDQVEEDYYRYTRAYLSEGDAGLVDRLEMMDVLERVIPGYAQKCTVTLTGNNAVLKVYADNLDMIAALQRALEADPQVEEVIVYSADKNRFTYDGASFVEASMLVRVLKEAK